jgi:uncharacterized protein YchJ
MNHHINVSVASLALIYLTATVMHNNISLPYIVVGLSLANEKKTTGRKINASSRVKKSTPKGFGRAESIDDLLRTYPTRLPDQTDNKQPCPCGVEEISYGDCCYPYHMKTKLPESPIRVLQSRYSAFVYRLIGYIIDTTHPTCRDYCDDKISWAKDLNKKGMFDSVEFVSLNITNRTNTNCTNAETISRSEDFVDFQVTLRSKLPTRQDLLSPTSTNGGSKSEIRIQERSQFIFNSSTGGWLYATGVVRSTGSGMDELILNL